MSGSGVPDPGDPTAIDPAAPAALDGAGMQELLDLVSELDADNERLRQRVLELLELMEGAVTAQVAGERRIAELEQHSAELRSELDAVRNTRVMRLTAPLRRAYGRLRARASTVEPGDG